MYATLYLPQSEYSSILHLLLRIVRGTLSDALKRYSPACTRLLSQYKTMLKLVSDDVPSIEQFMARYRVCT